MARRYELNAILEEIESNAWWVQSAHIQGPLKTKGFNFDTRKIGQLARILFFDGKIRRRRVEEPFQKYEYLGRFTALESISPPTT